MPYEIRKNGDKFCVYNKTTNALEGCSDTEEQAAAHMRALYAHENEKEAMGVIDILKDVFADMVQKLGNIGGNIPRSKLPDSDFVFPQERAFPIVTPEDVSDAVHSWGRYKGKRSFNEFKTRLIALCRRKGAAFVKQLPKEWEVKESKDVQEITVFKDADGTWNWLTISSTAFLDRDDEIVSKDALLKGVEDAERNGYDLGYLTYWHEPDIKVGKCTNRFVDGVCLVETGKWFDDELSTAIRKSVQSDPDLWAVSIEFMGNLTTAVENTIINGTQVKRIWNDISFKDRDRSILPAWRASNTFSMVATKGGVKDMKEERRAFLVEVAGEEIAKRVVEGVDTINKLAEEPDAVVKEQTVIDNEGTQVEQTVSQTETDIQTADKESKSLDALRAFAATLDEAKQKELAEIIIALAKELDEKKPEPRPGDDNPPDPTGYDPTDNDETAKEATTQPAAAEGTPDAQNTPKEQALIEQITTLETEVAELRNGIAELGNLVPELREFLKHKQQEDLPPAVVARAADSKDNVVTDKKEVARIKAQADADSSALNSMAQAVLNMLGGIQ